MGDPVRLVSFKLDHRVLREARLISLFRIALSFSERRVSEDRHDHLRRRAGFGIGVDEGGFESIVVVGVGIALDIQGEGERVSTCGSVEDQAAVVEGVLPGAGGKTQDVGVSAADLKFEGVAAEKMNGGADVIDAILDRARIGLAAEMVGQASEAFEITSEYLKTRRQFGQVIGGFQALQHRAAKLFTDLELTRSCVLAALDALDRGADTIAEYASLAKARASETLHLASNEMVQLHGGIGMTDEHDAGLYLKRARVAEALYGGASFHRDRYASLLGF